jgi:hypothetical protein
MRGLIAGFYNYRPPLGLYKKRRIYSRKESFWFFRKSRAFRAFRPPRIDTSSILTAAVELERSVPSVSWRTRNKLLFPTPVLEKPHPFPYWKKKHGLKAWKRKQPKPIPPLKSPEAIRRATRDALQRTFFIDKKTFWLPFLSPSYQNHYRSEGAKKLKILFRFLPLRVRSPSFFSLPHQRERLLLRETFKSRTGAFIPKHRNKNPIFWKKSLLSLPAFPGKEDRKLSIRDPNPLLTTYSGPIYRRGRNKLRLLWKKPSHIEVSYKLPGFIFLFPIQETFLPGPIDLTKALRYLS